MFCYFSPAEEFKIKQQIFNNKNHVTINQEKLKILFTFHVFLNFYDINVSLSYHLQFNIAKHVKKCVLYISFTDFFNIIG